MFKVSVLHNLSAIVISSWCLTRATYRVVTATLPPHGVRWYCSVLSVSVSFMETCRNTDEMNAEHGQKAPSVSVSIFNVEHKWALTSFGLKGDVNVVFSTYFCWPTGTGCRNMANVWYLMLTHVYTEEMLKI